MPKEVSTVLWPLSHGHPPGTVGVVIIDMVSAQDYHGGTCNHTGRSGPAGNESDMATKEQILQVLAENKGRLEAAFKVRRLALFGSYARGDQGEDSDVDILVEVDPSIGLDFVTLCETIEGLLGRRADVVSSRAVTPAGWKVIGPELIYV